MVKKILFGFAVLCAGMVPKLAQAAHVVPQTVLAVMETSASTYTVTAVDIGSITAASIVVDTSLLYKQVCAQNLDTSVALYCGDSASVSSQTARSDVGVLIPPASAATSPAQPTCFSIVAGMNFYCRSGGALPPARTVIIRAR